MKHALWRQQEECKVEMMALDAFTLLIVAITPLRFDICTLDLLLRCRYFLSSLTYLTLNKRLCQPTA